MCFFVPPGIQRLPDAAIIRYPPLDDLWLGRPDSNNTHYSSKFDLPLMEKCGIFFTFVKIWRSVSFVRLIIEHLFFGCKPNYDDFTIFTQIGLDILEICNL